jgi:hypothetical protein
MDACCEYPAFLVAEIRNWHNNRLPDLRCDVEKEPTTLYVFPTFVCALREIGMVLRLILSGCTQTARYTFPYWAIPS